MTALRRRTHHELNQRADGEPFVRGPAPVPEGPDFDETRAKTAEDLVANGDWMADELFASNIHLSDQRENRSGGADIEVVTVRSLHDYLRRTGDLQTAEELSAP